MGRKPCIEQKNLPSWFTVTEHRRATGSIYKTYFDTYNKQKYRSIQEVAKAFGLGEENEPCPKPLNIRKEDGSCGSLPMGTYTKIPAIPEYVGKDITSDSINLEQEELKKTGDVANTMKGEEEKDNEEVGYAASNLENEEEMAKKINDPSADAASMQDEDVAGEVKNRDHA